MSTAHGRELVKQMLKDEFEYCGGQPWWEGDHHSEGQRRHHNYYELKSNYMKKAQLNPNIDIELHFAEITEEKDNV